jgi:hypothetical protein
MSWIPEIMYEDTDEGMTSKIPFIHVPNEEEMPKVIFIFESRETGEIEPGPEGEDLPVFSLDLHQYANMNTLRDSLHPSIYNIVRVSLGLEPLDVATEKGKKITAAVRENLKNNV